MTKLVFTQKFKIGAHDVNSKRFLKITALMKMLQEASMWHIRALKASKWDLGEDLVSWVLLRKEINILRMPAIDDTIRVVTYPSGFDKFFAYRDYLVFDDQNKMVATASTDWAMIDLQSRKLAKIPQKIIDIGIPEGIRFLKRPLKTLELNQNLEVVDQRLVRQSDLDWNNHVSNIELTKWLLDPIVSLIGISDQAVARLMIHFKNEVKLGDQVHVLSGGDAGLGTLLRGDSDKQIKVMLRLDLSDAKSK